MRGRSPLPYRLREADRQYVHGILADGQLMQRMANRAQALLAFDRGERIGEIGVHTTFVQKLSLTYYMHNCLGDNPALFCV